MENKPKAIGVLLMLVLSLILTINIYAQSENEMGFYPSIQHVDIGDTFYLDAYVDIYLELDTAEVTNFSWAAPGIIDYSSCAQGDLLQGIVIYIDPDAPPGEFHNDDGEDSEMENNFFIIDMILKQHLDSREENSL